MVKLLLPLLFSLSVIACKNEDKQPPNYENPQYLDTLTIFDGGRLYSCCKTLSSTIVIDLGKPFKVQVDATYNSILFKKKFLMSDSVVVEIFHEQISFYKKEIMFRNNFNTTKNMTIKDTLIEGPTYRISKSMGFDGDKAAFFYVIFNSMGYLHFDVVDNRNIPKEEKIEKIEKIFKSAILINIPAPTIQIKGTIDTATYFEKCDWCVENCCLLIKGQTIDSLTNDVIFLVDQYDFTDCAELMIAANCIAGNYCENKYTYISFVDNMGLPNTYKRLAKFKVNNCKYDEYEDVFCHYADCIWMNPELVKRLYDSNECERWENFIKENSE